MTYEQYKEHVDARLQELGRQYGELMTTDNGDYYEPYSDIPCPICQRPEAGERYILYILNPGAAPEDIAEFEICGDCLMYIETGRIDDFRE